MERRIRSGFLSLRSWPFRLGGALKVRDAEIGLAGTPGRSVKANVGVAPLVYGFARYQASDRVALEAEFDAAAGPQGRAARRAGRRRPPAGCPARRSRIGRVIERTPSPVELAQWREEFQAASRRPLKVRMKYAFIKTYKPVLDDAPYRSFDTMAEYREWCQKNLPEWLGYGRTV